MNTEPIRLWPPLPCAIRQGDGICGKDAQGGYTWRQPETPGELHTPGLWLVQPVCRDCALAMLDNLLKGLEEDEQQD
jgi:hypothetical protein